MDTIVKCDQAFYIRIRQTQASFHMSNYYKDIK